MVAAKRECFTLVDERRKQQIKLYNLQQNLLPAEAVNELEDLEKSLT